MAVIDLYCERVGPGLTAEPLNALSNLAFALVAWRVWRRAGRAPELRLLAVLIAAIALGSLLFHSLANAWTQLADVVPIALFQLIWLARYLKRVLQFAPSKLAFSLFGYLALMAGCARWPALLNGSLAYAPAAGVLLVLGLRELRAVRPGAPLVLCAAAAAPLLLQGCAVARDQQTVGSYVDDPTLTTRIKAKFAADRTVSAMSINVETLKGVVQLSGFAKSNQEREMAETLARSVNGVVSVRNDIIVRG